MSYADFVEAPPLPNGVSKDPDDDKFLACAIAANISIVVSGDKDLLDVGTINAISVVTPRAFCDTYL